MEVEAGSRYIRGIQVPEEGRGARLPNTDGREDRVLVGLEELEAKLLGYFPISGSNELSLIGIPMYRWLGALI
jgi:hypothetical protein